MKNDQMQNKKTIFLTGGGTAGPVTPLLAVAEALGNKDYAFRWIGTRRGPERAMASEAGLPFTAIAAGKLRRYASLRNVIDPFFIAFGFLQALVLVIRYRPAWILSAGGFVSVPVAWAGWLLRRKVLIHQQDVRPGLANRLMAPFATVVTATFAKTAAAYGGKAHVVGNSVRQALRDAPKPAAAKKALGIAANRPVVFIFGGGTGAAFLNELVAASRKELGALAEIIHLTGAGKGKGAGTPVEGYQAFEFFTAEQMANAYAAADLVVARAGLATITELSFLGKPAIIIPMPGTHQIDNARLLEEHDAARVLDEPVLEQTFFVQEVEALLGDAQRRKQLGKNIKAIMPHEAAAAIAGLIRAQ